MKPFNYLVAVPVVVLFALPLLAKGAESIPLRAGPVTMIFDTDNVFLRYIKVGPHEVLRGITAPVRDSNWATVAPKLSNLQLSQHDGGFRLQFDVSCQEADIDFRWQGVITGTSEGVVEYHFDGQAFSSFKRNRIGFCVLHGPSAAGQAWLLETADGKEAPGHFPQFISPHQPAKNLRAITHDVTAGIRARVEFEGDVFEMEDQRNWTDASFKTYCTPLEIPYPVEIPEGTKISQKIRISLRGDVPSSDPASDVATQLTLEDTKFALPRLGLQVSSEVNELTQLQLERLRALNLDHLRIDLALSQDSFVNDLRRATQQANQLGVSLQIGLNVGETPAFDRLITEIAEIQPPVSAWLVTGVDPADFTAAHQRLFSVLGDPGLGVTETTNFVELNRSRPKSDLVRAIGFGINPQIHAFDNASMVETLPIHADVVNSARQFAAQCKLLIGPITLSPQFVDGTDPPGGPLPGALPTHVDARQVEPFAAAWTLGSLKYLAEAKADSITYFETVGWKGIMDVDDVSQRPPEFPSRASETFPIYNLLKEVGDYVGGQVQQVGSSDPLTAVGIALRRPGQMRVLLGNLTNETARCDAARPNWFSTHDSVRRCRSSYHD